QTQPCTGTKRTVSSMKRAGDGNRTRVVGLGSRSFTIKLRPHVTAVKQLSVQVEPCADMLPSAARTSLQLHDENASPHRTSCTPQPLHDTGHAILHETSAHALVQYAILEGLPDTRRGAAAAAPQCAFCPALGSRPNSVLDGLLGAESGVSSDLHFGRERRILNGPVGDRGDPPEEEAQRN